MVTLGHSLTRKRSDFQVKHAAALAVGTATWLRDEQAASRSSSVAAQPQTLSSDLARQVLGTYRKNGGERGWAESSQSHVTRETFFYSCKPQIGS